MTAQVLLDSHEAAQRLGVSKRTIEDWRLRGCGPRYRKHGRRVFYTEQALETWSESCDRQSTSEIGKEH